MNHIALIVNQNSGKADDPYKTRLCDLAIELGIPWARTADMQQAELALKKFASQNVNILAVYGGDGTLDAMLGLMRRQRIFESEPRILLLRGGTTNMTYRDAGFQGRPDQALKAVAQSAAVHTAQRPVMKIQHEGAPDLKGFFFGLGGVPRAIEATRKQLHTKGMIGPMSEALMVSSLLQRMVTGRVAGHPILNPGFVTIKTDEAETIGLNCVFLMVSTLQKQLLNLRPVLSKPGFLGVTALQYPYQNLHRNLGVLLNAEKDPPADSGIWRVQTKTLQLSFDGPWTLDGEIFEAQRDKPITLSLGLPATFCVKAPS